MGRPKGSKNKPKKEVVVPAEPSAPVEAALDPDELAALTLSLSDPQKFVEDFEPEVSTGSVDVFAADVNAPLGMATASVITIRDMQFRPTVFDPTQYAEDARARDGWPVPGDFKLPRRAYTIGDVFADLKKFDTPAKKVLWLRHNDKVALHYILKLAFDSRIKWLLPTGTPPYKEHKGRPGSAPSELLRETRRLYIFLEGGPTNLPRLKREKLFQQVIEGLEIQDVRALVAIKDKRVEEIYGLTPYLVEMAFPGLLAGPLQIKL